MIAVGQIQAAGYQFSFVEQNFKDFCALKQEILEDGITAPRVERLLGLARELGREFGPDCIEDAKAFLDSMKQHQGIPT